VGRGAAWQAGGMASRLPTFTNSVLTAALAGEGDMLLERRAGGDPELQRLMRPICDRQERGSKLQALQEALGARIHTLETQSAAARSTYDALSTAVSPQQRSNPATWSGGLAPPHFILPPPSSNPLHIHCTRQDVFLYLIDCVACLCILYPWDLEPVSSPKRWRQHSTALTKCQRGPVWCICRRNRSPPPPKPHAHPYLTLSKHLRRRRRTLWGLDPHNTHPPQP
jgi:hypothetical protein